MTVQSLLGVEGLEWSTATTWLLGLLALLGLARYTQRCAFYRGYLGHLPGRRFHAPVLGDLIYYVHRLNKDDVFDLTKIECSGNRMQPYRYWIGERPAVVLSAPEDVAVMLSSNKLLHKPEVGYGPLRSFFGDGLITINGDSWKHHRRALTPAFHFQVLERYVQVFTRRSRTLADRLLSLSAVKSGDSFDFLPQMSCFVVETIWETAFGMSSAACLDEDPAKKQQLLEAMAFVHDMALMRVFWPLLSSDWAFRLTPMYSRTKQAEQLIADIALAIIRSKKEEIAAEGREDSPPEEEDVGAKKRDAFLDLVLRQEDIILSEDEVLQEVRTLLAVQQTTATSLSFTAVLLAMHPEVQSAARREVQEIDAEGLEPREALSRMRYLERVIKESLRLFPSTPVISREAHEDLKLPDGRTVVPPGCMVVALLVMTHRHPRHWPDPERFDPDRFLPERCAERHPYAFVPFSAGSRSCIGQRYAMLQMKAVLAELLRRFRLLPGPGCQSLQELRVSMNILMYVVGGFNVRLQPLAPATDTAR